MKTLFGRLRDEERGFSLFYVTAGFLGIFAASALAIDVGMMATARGQAQNAADAGALAGAVALALNDFDDHSSGGPAVQAAMNAAVENHVIGDPVSVEPSDVTFPAGSGGQFNRVRVHVYRSAARNNPLTTFISGIMGIHNVDMQAVATAEASPANAVTCVRPFTIPDRWTENNVPPNNTFDRYDNKGKVIANADVYTPGVNSYDADRDKGTLITLRAGSGNNIEPTFYYSWSMPGNDQGIIGGDWYKQNIAQCNQFVFTPGYIMTQEPGNMMGPTIQGMNDLIAQDPTAYWDSKSGEVKSPLGRSPRVFPIPLYDPDFYQIGKMTGRKATLKMVGWIGFFAESTNGNNEVYGRMVPILGTIDPNAGPAPDSSYPKAIRLVE